MKWIFVSYGSNALRFAFAAAVLAWCFSLLLPAVITDGGRSYSGYEVLTQGFAAVRFGVIAWFANPLLLITVVAGFAGFYRVGAASAALAGGIALTSFAAETTARANGAPLPELSFGSGFFVWIAAIFAIFATCLLGFRLTLPKHKFVTDRRPPKSRD